MRRRHALHQKISTRLLTRYFRESARRIFHFKYSDDNFDRNEIQHILENCVHAKDLSRDEWRSVGMILKRYGFEFAGFDA